MSSPFSPDRQQDIREGAQSVTAQPLIDRLVSGARNALRSLGGWDELPNGLWVRETRDGEVEVRADRRGRNLSAAEVQRMAESGYGADNRRLTPDGMDATRRLLSAMGGPSPSNAATRSGGDSGASARAALADGEITRAEYDALREAGVSPNSASGREILRKMREGGGQMLGASEAPSSPLGGG